MVNTRIKKMPTKTILVVAVLVMVVVSLWSLSLSPYFRVTDVVVKGHYFCPQDYLSEILDPGRLGNIFTLSTGAIRQKLERNPWINAAVVQRVLPTTLEVTLTETYPVAALATGEGFVLVSPDGIAIQSVQQLAKYGVPVLTTALPVPIREGEKIEVPYLTETAQAISGLQFSGLPASLSQANLSADSQLTLYFNGGLKVTWGDLTDFDHKLQLLLVIISEEGGDLDHISQISLSDGDGPVVLHKLN